MSDVPVSDVLHPRQRRLEAESTGSAMKARVAQSGKHGRNRKLQTGNLCSAETQS